MSGIAGIVSPRHDALQSIRPMVASMAHRGPDGLRADTGDGFAFGHCAMHTTPEAMRERLPMRHPETGVVLTADARIDNRDDLTALLDLKDADPTDADLLLHAYLKWGRSAPEHLIGDFAFAIWDPRDRTLFAARDHIGVRPFYYHAGRDAFYFGSEIKAIRAAAGTRFGINEDRVAEYIARQALTPDATFFAGIHRLPPAHSLTLGADGFLRLERYWALDPDYETVYATDAEYEEAFREIFTEAVRCRMRANDGFAVLLSGGLDSSSVACVARDLEQVHGGGPVDTYTARFGYDRADESEYLDALADQGGFRMHDVDLHGADPLEHIERMVHHLDQPPVIANSYMHVRMGKAAQKRGHRVLLDGSEGDITVSYGFGRIGELALAGRWDDLQQELSALAGTTGVPVHQLFRANAAEFLSERMVAHPLRFTLSDSRRAAKLADSARWRLLARVGKEAVRSRRSGDDSAAKLIRESLLNRDLAASTQIVQRLDEALPRLSHDTYSDRWRHAFNVEGSSDAISTVLEETNHVRTMTGSEARHPFYDVRLVEYCVSLPSAQKLRNGLTRSIQRRGLAYTLPQVVASRMSKGDLSDNFIEEINNGYSGTISEMIEDDSELIGHFFHIPALERAQQRGDAHALWTVIALLNWFNDVYSGKESERHSIPAVETRVSSGTAITYYS